MIYLNFKKKKVYIGTSGKSDENGLVTVSSAHSALAVLVRTNTEVALLPDIRDNDWFQGSVFLLCIYFI